MVSRNRSGKRRPPAVLLGLLLPLVFLAAAGAGLAFARLRPPGIVGIVLGACLAAVVVWILVSVLWPARAERRCTRCGEPRLERLDPRATHGVVCRACGWRDEAESAWLLAEEEGPLEHIVLEERGRRRGESAVDTTRSED